MDDRTTTVGLALLTATLTVAGLLHTAARVSAAISGLPQPAGGLAQAFGVLAVPATPGTALGMPGLHPGVYWTTVAVLLSIVGLIMWGIVRLCGWAPGTTPGIATGRQVRAAASSRAVLARATTLRPSLDRPRPHLVGYRIGRSRRNAVWATVEDSMLILGPPRSGKGLHVVINTILDAPGAVVATSTRPDNLHATRTLRSRRGPVAVFDPQGLLGPDQPAGLRWAPMRGCADPGTAMTRAAGLAAGTGLSAGGVESGGFWEAKTRSVLQTLLHAAALDNRDAATLYEWSLTPVAATDAARILHTHPDAATGWAATLTGTIDAEPRSRDAVWHGVSLALAALANPTVLDALTPRGDEPAFDPASFLRDHGTLHLLATSTGASPAASLVAAFVEDLVETARQLAATAPGGRLDPPLLLALDEIANLTPLPSLPTLMADGGGIGITTMPVLQSLAQARHRWGDHAAQAIFDAASIKIILGGSANSRDLTDLTTLLGDRDDPTTTTNRDPHGRRSTSHTHRRLPILPPDAIRTLAFGHALILHRAAPPILATLTPWTRRRDLHHDR